LEEQLHSDQAIAEKMTSVFWQTIWW